MTMKRIILVLILTAVWLLPGHSALGADWKIDDDHSNACKRNSHSIKDLLDGTSRNPLENTSNAPKLITRVMIAHGRVETSSKQMIAHAPVPQTRRSGSHLINRFGLNISVLNGIGIA